jgi:hypothetical protein
LRVGTALLAAAVLLATACGRDDGSIEDAARSTLRTFAPVSTAPAGFDRVTTTMPQRPTEATANAPGTDPAPDAPPDEKASALLAQLTVADEESPIRYERDRFDHWTDADRDGCDTRCEVLAAERRSDLPALANGWYSMYDGYTTDDPTELEIDHVVALAEAWRSGASAWDDSRRRDFANDLDEPGALVAVTAATNRAKSDKDPAHWQPPNRSAWCEWALGWTRTKAKWQLTADQAEIQALRNILSGC